MTKETGGAAFPCTYRLVTETPMHRRSEMVSEPGMTLRDWFAGMALQGFLSYSHHNEVWGYYHNNDSHEDLAKHSYKISDAMLAARGDGDDK